MLRHSNRWAWKLTFLLPFPLLAVTRLPHSFVTLNFLLILIQIPLTFLTCLCLGASVFDLAAKPLTWAGKPREDWQGVKLISLRREETKWQAHRQISLTPECCQLRWLVKSYIVISSPKYCRAKLSRLFFNNSAQVSFISFGPKQKMFFNFNFIPSDGGKDKTPKAKKEVKEKETKEVKEVTKEPKEIKDKAPPPPPKVKSPKVSPPPKSPKKSPVTKSPTPPPRARPTRRSVSKSVSKSPSPAKRAPRARSSSSSGSSRSPRRRKRSPTPKPTKLYVAHLTRNVTKDHVFEIFSVYGHVKAVDLPMDRFNFLPRGFAYVEYDEAEDAENALKHMDGGQIDGQEITTQMVHPMRPRDVRPARRPSPPPPRRRPPPPAWRRSPPARFRGPFRAGRRSRSPSPRRRSRSKSRSRSRSPPRRRRYSRSSSSSSR